MYKNKRADILSMFEANNKYRQFEIIESNISVSGAVNQPSNLEVDKMLEEVEKYTLASHLFWGLWGIISVFMLLYIV